MSNKVLIPTQGHHPYLADAVTLHPVCQEKLYNPGREVSINPNENSIGFLGLMNPSYIRSLRPRLDEAPWLECCQ